MEELLGMWQFILLIFLKHVLCTQLKNVYETLQCLYKKKKIQSRTRMHLNGANSQHKKQAWGTAGVLTHWGTGVHPLSLRVKFLWEKGAPRRNAGLRTAGPNRSPATETRPRQPFHLRPEGDSGPAPAIQGWLRPGFRRKAVRAEPTLARSRSYPHRHRAESRRPRPLSRPVRGRGLAHARGRRGGRVPRHGRGTTLPVGGSE